MNPTPIDMMGEQHILIMCLFMDTLWSLHFCSDHMVSTFILISTVYSHQYCSSSRALFIVKDV